MYIWKDKNKDVFLSLIGGIEEYDGEILILPMGRWLFLFGFFFLLAGLEVMKIKRVSYFVCYRHSTFKHWWKKQFIHIHLMVVILFGIALLTWLGCSIVQGKSLEDIGVISVTFLIHICLMVTIEICFDVLFSKALTGGILIVVEGVLYIIAEQYQIPWLAGGMYIRSSKMLENGFALPVMYVAEILFMLVCYGMILFMWKKGYMEELQNGKND